MTFLRTYGAATVAALSLTFFVPALASAATGLTIQPVRIDQTLNAGDVAHGEILLTNASDGPVDVEVSVEDFIPTAGAESIKFVSRAEGVTSVRDWVSVAGGATFSLALNESKTLPYTVTVPQDGEPGGHFGVVFFKATPQGVSDGSLKVGTQVGMLVLIKIPGNHLEKGRILKFSAPGFLQGPPVPFEVEFENTGTVHFEPKGEVSVKNIFGAEVARVPLEGQVVLPTSIKTLKYTWNPRGFLFGRYSATATLYDGEGTALTAKSISFWVVPVWYVAGFLACLVLVYFLLRFIKRHVRVSLK